MADSRFPEPKRPTSPKKAMTEPADVHGGKWNIGGGYGLHDRVLDRSLHDTAKGKITTRDLKADRARAAHARHSGGSRSAGGSR